MHVFMHVKCVCCLFMCLIAFTRKHRLTILSWDFGFRHVAICNSVAVSDTLIRGSPILLGFPPFFVDYLSRIFFRYPLSPLSFNATIKLWRAIHSSCNGRLNLFSARLPSGPVSLSEFLLKKIENIILWRTSDSLVCVDTLPLLLTNSSHIRLTDLVDQ